MKTLILYFHIFLFAGLSHSCQKINIGQNGTVDFYLLDKYSTINQSCRIDENSVKTEKEPIIKYEDLLLYDNETYTFQLAENAAETVKNLHPSVYGLPFAIKANDELIYTGYFWPSYSSASCSWITIDPVMMEDNKIIVKKGYPGQIEGETIPDKRNDERILSIFRKDKKLR